MKPQCFEVIRDIAEIGALVWDVLVFGGSDIVLVRKRYGKVDSWLYPSQYTFLFLKYEDHLMPMDSEGLRLHDLAQAELERLPRPSLLRASGAPYLVLEP